MESLSPSFLNKTIGAALVGAIISSTLFGVVVLQTYTYFARFPTDRLVLKGLVGMIWACELSHCTLICHSAYSMLITHYGDPPALIAIPPSLSVAVALTGITEALVQNFFAYRIFVVSNSNKRKNKKKIPFVSMACCSLSIARCALTLTTAGVSMRSASAFQFFGRYKPLIGAALGVGSGVVLAASLLYYLVFANGNANGKASSNLNLHLGSSTDGNSARTQRQVCRSSVSLMDSIVAWTVQSGVTATLISSGMLVAFFASSESYIWLAIFSFMSRIFSISFLASLNGRTILLGKTFALQPQAHYAVNSITLPSPTAMATISSTPTLELKRSVSDDVCICADADTSSSLKAAADQYVVDERAGSEPNQ